MKKKNGGIDFRSDINYVFSEDQVKEDLKRAPVWMLRSNLVDLSEKIKDLLLDPKVARYELFRKGVELIRAELIEREEKDGVVDG